jgi:hypothetical protein
MTNISLNINKIFGNWRVGVVELEMMKSLKIIYKVETLLG